MFEMKQELRDEITSSAAPLAPVPTGMPARTEVPGQIRAVLFDVYGTLLVSGSGDVGTGTAGRNAQAVLQMMRRCGMPRNGAIPADPDEIARLVKDLIEEAHAEAHSRGVSHPEIDIRRIWRSLFSRLPGNGEDWELPALVYEMNANPVWPMPGFPSILHTLSDAGFPLGIVSNAQFYTPLIMEVLAGKPLKDMGLDPELCSWSYVHLQAKPSPHLFIPPLEALEKRGIRPRQVLYVGNDMRNDVTTAAACGCRTALFAGDKRSLRLREEDGCLPEDADMILTELGQLEKLIHR